MCIPWFNFLEQTVKFIHLMTVDFRKFKYSENYEDMHASFISALVVNIRVYIYNTRLGIIFIIYVTCCSCHPSPYSINWHCH